MSYWRLFYHLVWATKHREPLLTETLEPRAHDFMRMKALELDGLVFAVNGTETHVHMVVSIPPRLSVTEFVGQVKGHASYKINRTGDSPSRFSWQGEYGVFSFDQKRLPNYVGYVERQKEHHAADKVIPILERTDEQPLQVREGSVPYETEDTDWWAYMMALG